MDALLTHASNIYAAGYFGALILVALLEQWWPRRAPGQTLALRWTHHLALTIVNAVFLRAVLPMAGIAWAVVCADREWGLFNHTRWPAAIELIGTIVAFDLLLYAQHRLLHRVPVLWRIHRTHHSDHEYDFSTGVRFHPLEALFTGTLQLGLIAVLGAAPVAVFLSQLLEAVSTFVEHANVRVPDSIDRLARLVIVTPDMHRIHHSQRATEGRSNLSTTFSWWDRLFGTYLAQPHAGHAAMQVGLRGFSDRKHCTLPWMLAQPFLADRAPVAAPAGRVDVPAMAPTAVSDSR